MIRTLCGSIGTDNSEIVKFTTGNSEGDCARVLGLKNETPTENSVLIIFGAVHGSSQYLIFYKKEGDEFAKSVLY